jgi:hypothetical protein
LPIHIRFRASAYGAAGTITTPFREHIPTQASSMLAALGGYASARSENFAHREIMRFDLACTEVTGSQTHLDGPVPTYSTLAKSTIEGLNIMGMITADRVVANLVSTYRPGEGAEPSIKLIGSRFENLKIAGIPVKVHLNHGVLDRYHDHKSLKAAYKTDKKVRDLFGDDDLRKRHAGAPARVKEFLDAPPTDKSAVPEYDGVISTSIVGKIEPEGDAFECYGHVIHIEGFGVIRLGEVRIERKTRHLSMIRVRFGCPFEGDACAGIVDDGTSNGN